MGLFNTIGDKRTKCPYCNFDFTTLPNKSYHNLNFQSKDTSSRCNYFELGKKLIIQDGGLEFEAKGDTVWSGCASCFKCRKFIQVLIFIRKGIIDEIRIVDLECPKCKSDNGDFSVYGDKKGFIMNCKCWDCKHYWEQKGKNVK